MRSLGRLRAINNIWVADASVFPSAGDRHPTLTVLAHALRGCTGSAAPSSSLTAIFSSIRREPAFALGRGVMQITKKALLQHVKRTVRSIAATQVSRHPSGKPAATDKGDCNEQGDEFR
jgi:hypothetical protein